MPRDPADGAPESRKRRPGQGKNGAPENNRRDHIRSARREQGRGRNPSPAAIRIARAWLAPPRRSR